MYKHFFKNIFDFLFALAALLFLSPFILIIIVLLFFNNKGKPFFFQTRPGKNEKLFKIIKFKTMKDIDPNISNDIHSLNRVTKIGSFIRKYSLDEILQLVNVLKGDMSLIGPRPLLIEYLPLYNENQKIRHNVKPGITGWAQVKGRNAISWNQKFEYDIWYVKNLSFTLDMRILLLTILKVIKKDGVNTNQNVTMEVWKGNNI
ncbi:sugar transferase [Sabulilitoribacter multivorans]|uniref:Sugar transferase n=1 Tax=Flaviramulus multivorans TaxID=1304750 RepID=A0ABS9IJN1_9FLAO|nr:sugar transferase [Flaviramulus multivorans]MCF7560805.1 sugar transferase [Flaviramulus multivorans]